MHSEMIGPVAFRRLERVGSLDAEAAERAFRHIVSELVQQRQVALNTQITDNTLKNTGDSLDAQAARNTFATGLVVEIAATLHRPMHHARVLRQHLNHARPDDGTGFFQWIKVEGCSQQRDGQGPPLSATNDYRPHLIIGMSDTAELENIA